MKFIARSIVCPGATSLGSGISLSPLIASPLTSKTRYVFFHGHVPAFLNLQIFVKELPGIRIELSGTVKLATSSIRSQPLFGVGLGPIVCFGSGVEVRICVRAVIEVDVFVG